MDRGPSELELAVEAAWALSGEVVGQDLLDVLLDVPEGRDAVVEGVRVRRLMDATRFSPPRWTVAGPRVPLELSLAEIGAIVQKARIRRELGG